MRQLAKITAFATMLALASSASADLNRVGPANVPAPPGNGFPAWYQDLNGMVLDLCLPTVTATQDPAVAPGDRLPPRRPRRLPTSSPPTSPTRSSSTGSCRTP